VIANGVVFRDAMARFAAGVTIVTTLDVDGSPRGFTASAFCSVSVYPPLVLVCLATAAECHRAFTAGTRFVVNVLGQQHREHAILFATRGADKFADPRFGSLSGAGEPVLHDAVATIACQLRRQYDGGDHTILIGEASAAWVRPGEPLVYVDRSFVSVERAPSGLRRN
jgi:flavin reductase ActVB